MRLTKKEIEGRLSLLNGSLESRGIAPLKLGGRAEWKTLNQGGKELYAGTGREVYEYMGGMSQSFILWHEAQR